MPDSKIVFYLIQKSNLHCGSLFQQIMWLESYRNKRRKTANQPNFKIAIISLKIGKGPAKEQFAAEDLHLVL